MKKILNEDNQIHNFISSFITVISYGSGSDFLTSYGSGSTSQKVTVPTVPVPVPQHWLRVLINSLEMNISKFLCALQTRRFSPPG